jgi:hypothetical protein
VVFFFNFILLSDYSEQYVLYSAVCVVLCSMCCIVQIHWFLIDVIIIVGVSGAF